MQNDFKPSKTVDLFECLSEKEKVRGKRKGIRMAKIENFIFKIKNLFKHRCPDCNGIMDRLLSKMGDVKMLVSQHRAISIGFDESCVSWFRCTQCQQAFNSHQVYVQTKNDNGTQKYCPHCETELKGLDGLNVD